jgi:hypothetical protein
MCLATMLSISECLGTSCFMPFFGLMYMSRLAPARNRRNRHSFLSPNSCVCWSAYPGPPPSHQCGDSLGFSTTCQGAPDPAVTNNYSKRIRRCCIVIASDQTSRSPEPSEGAAIRHAVSFRSVAEAVCHCEPKARQSPPCRPWRPEDTCDKVHVIWTSCPMGSGAV